MIQHSTHLTRYKSSEAQTLETSLNFGKLMGPRKKAEILQEVARIHMSLGNVEKYCEIMLQLDEWEKALAVAPAVSLEYWRLLSARYATRLSRAEDEEASVYWMASQDVRVLCKWYMGHNQYNDAMLTVQVARENNFPTNLCTASSTNNTDNHQESSPTESGDMEKLHSETGVAMSEWYFSSGKPVLAACCHLSVGDIDGAVYKLVRGNELELAYSLSRVVSCSLGARRGVALLLAKRCQRYR